MRIGSWLFCRTKDLEVAYFYPYSKKGKNMVFQPYLCLKTPSGRVIVHGKRPLWSLLDAMFPDSPLPRNPVNNDFKDATTALEAINDMLQDPDAWPYLRLQVRTGNWRDHFGYPTNGTFALSVSPSASDYDITSNLILLEKTTEASYIMPLTIHTKTKLRTVPALIIPLDSDNDFKVILTDSIGGNHLVFSVIEKSNSAFRPRRMITLPFSNTSNIQKELELRLKELKDVSDLMLVYPEMSPLDAGMRFYERDDLEFRRFQSIESFSSVTPQQKE